MNKDTLTIRDILGLPDHHFNAAHTQPVAAPGHARQSPKSEDMEALKIGDRGTYYPSAHAMNSPEQAEVVHVWSDTCVNLKTDSGGMLKIVFVYRPGASERPSGYYFEPAANANVDKLEKKIADKASRAPRVTPADIEDEIAGEHYFTAREGVLGALAADGVPATAYEKANAAPAALGLLTFCVLVLRNGFTVTGESAVASPENFDADIGRKVARAAAVSKCWPLLGFRLRDCLCDRT